MVSLLVHCLRDKQIALMHAAGCLGESFKFLGSGAHLIVSVAPFLTEVEPEDKGSARYLEFKAARADLFRLAGIGYSYLNDNENAEQSFRKQVEDLSGLGSSLSLAIAHRNLGSILFNAGKHREALNQYDIAETYYSGSDAYDSALKLKMGRIKIKMLNTMGDTQRAKEVLEELKTHYNDSEGETERVYKALIGHDMAETLVLEDDLMEAKEVIALAIGEVSGIKTQDARVTRYGCHLLHGQILFKIGDFREAARAFKLSAEACLDYGDEESTNKSKALRYCAKALSEAGEYLEAVNVWRRVLEVTSDVKTPLIEVAEAFRFLGIHELRRGRAVEAAKMLQTSTEKIIDLGDGALDEEDVVTTVGWYAVALESLGDRNRLEEAAKHLESVCTYCENNDVNPSQHEKFLESLANCKQKLGDRRGADRLRKKATAISMTHMSNVSLTNVVDEMAALAFRKPRRED